MGTVQRHDERAAGAFAEPALLAAAAGVVAVGLLARRGDLVRGGARLFAIQMGAAAIAGAIRRGISRRGGDIAAPPPLAIDAMAGWLAEAAVGMAVERIALAAAGREPAAAVRRRPPP